MKALKYSLLLIFLVNVACSESNKKQSKQAFDISSTEANATSSVLSINPAIESSSVLLTIERGAFHYDKFILNDTIITFYPSSESFGEKNDKYNQVSEQKISKQTRDTFIEKIIGDGFFKLKDSYASETSDNSHLTVTLTYNNKTKKIVSEDYDRECPELLKFIEQELIRMHGKGLKRIFLPG